MTVEISILIILSIFVLFMIVGGIITFINSRDRKLLEEKLKNYYDTTCFNCGGKKLKFFYQGYNSYYCPSCNLGIKPVEIFYNSFGNEYAEKAGNTNPKDCIIDLKYIPSLIKPSKCNVCGAISKYSDPNWGHSKCISCGKLT